MRKFRLQVQTSIDDYMAGPNDTPVRDVPFTEDVYDYMDALNESVNCMVLGRKTAEGLIPYWAARPEDEPEALIDFINTTPKVVISTTLTTSPGRTPSSPAATSSTPSTSSWPSQAET